MYVYARLECRTLSRGRFTESWLEHYPNRRYNTTVYNIIVEGHHITDIITPHAFMFIICY